MKVSVIIAAAGKSRRMGRNKLLLHLGEDATVICAVRPFLSAKDVSQIVVCTASEDYEAVLHEFERAAIDMSYVNFAVGGETRAESVCSALALVHADTDVVLIHDGARPHVTTELIERVATHAAAVGAAVPVVPSADAVLVNDVPFNKKYVRLVQTPQGFDCTKLRAAYMLCSQRNLETMPDDFTVWCAAYGECPEAIVEGDPANRKITTVADLPHLYGTGYDIHRFSDSGDFVTLGGVRVPNTRGVVAHSDGDVLLHAVMDAILSVAGLPDIGVQFPNSDERFRGISSMLLLSEVLELARENGVTPVRISATIIAETPKITPYVKEIRSSIAKACGIPCSAVGICATTNESVGEIGKGEAIAASVIVTARAF